MNNSPSTISPAWPTRWPQDSFRFGPTALLVVVAIGAAVPILLGGLVWLFVFGAHGATLAEIVVPSIVVQLAVEAAIVAVILIGLPRVAKMSLRDLGFTPLAPWQIGIAILGAVAMVVVVEGGATLFDAITHSKHEQNVVEIFKALKAPGTMAFFAFFAIVLAPIAEETIFRIFIFNIGLRWGGFWIGAIVSGLCFGAAHGDPYVLLPLALGGIILCGVYYRTRCAYASMITHGLFNATTIAALLFAPQLAK